MSSLTEFKNWKVDFVLETLAPPPSPIPQQNCARTPIIRITLPEGGRQIFHEARYYLRLHE